MNVYKLILYFIISAASVAVLPYSTILMPFLLILSAALFVAMSARWNVLYSVFSAAFAGIIARAGMLSAERFGDSWK